MNKKNKNLTYKSKAGTAAKVYFVINLLLGLLLIVAGGYQVLNMIRIQKSAGYSMITSSNIEMAVIPIVIGIVLIFLGWVGKIVISTFGKIEKNIVVIRRDSDELIAALRKEVPEEEPEKVAAKNITEE